MPRPPILAAAAAVTCLAAMPALAGEPCPLNYEEFEAVIPHIDLDACPKPLENEDSFCREIVKDDEAHVFRFALDNELCLLEVAVLPLAEVPQPE